MGEAEGRTEGMKAGSVNLFSAVSEWQRGYAHMLALTERVQRALEQAGATEEFVNVGIERIKEIVAEEFGIPVALMAARQRDNETALARQIAMHVARKMTPFSSAEIGRCFRRDHGTVLHNLDVINSRCSTDAKFAAMVAEIERKCAVGVKGKVA